MYAERLRHWENDERTPRQIRKAIRAYTKSLKFYPTDAWALWNRGFGWKGLGQVEKAEKDRSAGFQAFGVTALNFNDAGSSRTAGLRRRVWVSLSC